MSATLEITGVLYLIVSMASCHAYMDSRSVWNSDKGFLYSLLVGIAWPYYVPYVLMKRIY